MSAEVLTHSSTPNLKKLEVLIQPGVGGTHEPNLSIDNAQVIARPIEQGSLKLRANIPDIEPLGDDLKVFDASLYRKLFNQALDAGLSREQAREVVVFATTYDGVGLVTEKISGEKDGNDNYYFDVETRIRMQLTPLQHFYLQEEDESTHEPMMVAPEHQWGKFKKDVMVNISAWRRGMDKVGMWGVRTIFLDQADNSLKAGESIFWGSPIAEEWEEEEIIKYNGKYGFLYWGRVININGVKVLEVHDFKNDLSPQAYDLLYNRLDGEVYTNPLYLHHPLVDKVKASFVRSNKEWNIEEVWGELGKVQKEITGKEEVFSLPIYAIVALQDPELHQRIRAEVAVPIGTWIGDEIYGQAPIEEIQNQIRQKFIDQTVRLVSKIKVERANIRDQSVAGRASVYTESVVSFNDYRDINIIDPRILARYSGSNGDGCGVWGNTKLSRNGRVSSVAGLSRVFGTRESIGGACGECGGSTADDHYHCKCGKWYASERDIPPEQRTKQCSCGVEFGC